MGRFKKLEYNLVKKCKLIKYGKKQYQKIKHILFNLPKEVNITKTLKFRQFINYSDEDYGVMCVATSWCNAISIYILKNYNKIFEPSPYYLHYFTRFITFDDGDDEYDIDTIINGGCDPYDCIDAIQSYGICSKNQYNNYKNIPTENDICNSLKNVQDFDYLKIKNNLNTIKMNLYQLNPIIMSIDLDGTEYDESDTLKMPNVNSEIEPDGHAILLIGYNDTRKEFTYLDRDGFYNIEYDYVLNKNVTSDLFIVKKI